MLTLIPALGALALAVLAFLPGGVPAAFTLWRDGGLVVLSLVLLWQGIAALRAPAAPPQPSAAPAASPPPPPPPRAAPAPAPGGEALVLLALLQEKGRFLDFVSEDITSYNDTQVAAASRVVHQGCSAVIRECLALAPTHPGAEGDAVTLDAATDPARYRLLGKVSGSAPFRGVVVHRGWTTRRIALPRLTRAIDPAGENVITPMDVELR
jgi:hypothetical protein